MLAPRDSLDPVVLCVDDDPSILSALRRVLAHERLEVVTTATPEEALKRVESGRVNLVISDQRMPGMNGADFLDMVRRRSPDTIRVLLTGYPESGLVSEGLSRGIDWLITKPWSDGALRGAVRQLLGGGRLDVPADAGSPRLIQEITRRLGYFPPLFAPAARVPGLLRAFWTQTQAAYLDAPFAAPFKEKLFAGLSRFRSSPYLLVAHSCALRPLGWSAAEILDFLQEPPPATERDLGPRGPDVDRALFRRAVALFHGGPAAGFARKELLEILGDDGFTRLQALLSYVSFCQAWAEARPEITPDVDPRVRAHLKPLTDEEPRLADVFQGRAGRAPEAEGERLTRSQQLRAIGQLSAGIAHEINNPAGYMLSNLTAMKGYLDDLSRLVRADGAERERLRGEIDAEFLMGDFGQALEETRQGAEKIREITRSLRDFSRADEGAREEADLRDVIEESLRVCRSELKYKAEVARDYGPLGPVACFPRRIRQVVVNLLVNAAQAIEERGEIRVSTRAEGPWAVIRVRDSGRGIPAEALPRIFEPFFSTQPVGEGAGLGLHVAWKIVRAHGGDIEVSSKVGEGTEVSVRLPLSKPEDPAPAGPGKEESHDRR